jgi:hypothetical protein
MVFTWRFWQLSPNYERALNFWPPHDLHMSTLGLVLFGQLGTSLSSCMAALLHSHNLSLVDLSKSFCSFIFLISTNSPSYSLAALGRQRQLCHRI